MNRRHLIASAGATLGAAAVGVRPARAAEMSEQELRSLGKTDLKICLQPGLFKLPMVEAIDQIAKHGFPGVESLSINPNEVDAIRKKLDETGVVWRCTGAGIASIGSPKDWKKGLGISAEEEHDAIEKSFRERCALAKRLNIKCLLGLTGQKRQDMSAEKQTEIIVKGLKRLAPIAQEHDMIIVLEILNVLVNHPGYFLVYTPQGAEIIQAVNHPNVKLLYDIYHQQISEGNLIANIKKYISCIGHFHIGDNPGRQYPGTGEINYRNVFKAIKDTGYDGYLAMECGYGNKTPLEIMKIMHDLTKFS
ncbi:MAG: TIM barrel protein [Candidatus Sumerlaeia bacterium]|nr:TIM barrel protein [Candidatus Sumerlaeia bacterium]